MIDFVFYLTLKYILLGIFVNSELWILIIKMA